MDVVTPTDRLKSVRNRCEIGSFGGVFVLSMGCWMFCWYTGFRHGTESELVLSPFLNSMTDLHNIKDAPFNYISVQLHFRFDLLSPRRTWMCTALNTLKGDCTVLNTLIGDLFPRYERGLDYVCSNIHDQVIYIHCLVLVQHKFCLP